MLKNNLKNFANSMRLRAFHRFLTDRRGVSGIEFAFILPIVLVLFAGAVDLGQALMVNRKINQIVATTADLIAQEEKWNHNDVDAVMAGVATILEPYDISGLKITMAVVDVNPGNGTAKVSWSNAYNADPLSKGTDSPVTIDRNIMEKGVQLVVAEATYSLTTIFATFLEPVTGSTSYEYVRTAIIRPRNSDEIELK